MARPISVTIVGDTRQLEGALDDAAEATNSFADRMKNMSGKAVAAVGAVTAAIGGIALAFNEALDIEAANDKLAAQLGLTEQQAKQAAGVASNVYKQAWGESMGDVNEAIASVSGNIQDLNSLSAGELEAMTIKALALRDTFGVEVAESTAAVGDMIKNGLAKNADEAFDILTRGFQTGANKSDDLIDTFREYSVQFAKLGIDGPHALQLINQGLSQGAWNADKVADAVKEFGIRAIDGSKGTTEAYQALGLDADATAQKIAAGGPTAAAAMQDVIVALGQVGDKIQQDALGVALFGTQWEDLGGHIITSMRPATAAVDGVTGATQKMADTVGDNAKSKVEAFKREAMDMLMRVLADKVIPVLEKVINFCKEWQDVLIPLAVGIGGVVVAMKAFAMIQGMIAAVRTIITVVRSWTIVQWALNAALLANPIGIVIAAVAALVAGIIWAWHNFEGFRDFVKAMWEVIKQVFRIAIQVILHILTGGLYTIITHWKEIWGAVSAFFGWIWDGIKATFKAAVDWVVGIAEGFVNFFAALPGRIATFFTGMWDGMVDGFKAAINWIIDRLNNVTGGISSLWDWTGLPSIPEIPKLAAGGTVTRSGGAIVGERGPELLNLPTGASVVPLQHRAGSGGNVVVNVHVAGNVRADRELAATIRDELLRVGARNGGVGLA